MWFWWEVSSIWKISHKLKHSFLVCMCMHVCVNVHRYWGNGSICLMDKPEVRRCRRGQKGIMVPLFLLSPDLPRSVIWTGHWGYTVRVSGPQRPDLPHRELGCVCVCEGVGCVLGCQWKISWHKLGIMVCYRLWMAHPVVVLFLCQSYWYNGSLGIL